MTTYPFSKLSADVQANVVNYDGTRFVTFVKPVFDGFVRFAIGNFSDIDKMLNEGWMVVNRAA